MRRTGYCSAVGMSTVALFACATPPLESPQVTEWVQVNVAIPQKRTNKVDLLFMVDNSNSMSAMTEQLKQRFDQLFKVFQDLAAQSPPTYADLQIGVVTSDYGAGKTGAPGCQPSPGGQRGRLQALGESAPQGCLPPVGLSYLRYDFDPAHAQTRNLPNGQNLVQTFTCMASVGDSGCGFEHQLESVYAALHDPLPENAGFLRDDALLAVVFLTNEDDSSAPTDSMMFDKSDTAQWGYESSYRQTRWGIECMQNGSLQLPPYGDSGGPLTGCVPATNPPGAEYDVNRYINFFTLPKSQGGVKNDPKSVILFGIDAPGPAEGGVVQTLLSWPSTTGGQPYTPCSPLNEASNPACVPVLQHSCMNPRNPVFFGDPAVRLNAVIHSAKGGSQISSICDDDYTNALESIGRLIVIDLGNGCIPGKLPDPSNPECVVQDVITNADGTVTTTQIPRCDEAGGALPCWSAVMKTVCACQNNVCAAGQSPDAMSVVIDRGSTSVPTETDVKVYCSTT